VLLGLHINTYCFSENFVVYERLLVEKMLQILHLWYYLWFITQPSPIKMFLWWRACIHFVKD